MRTEQDADDDPNDPSHLDFDLSESAPYPAPPTAQPRPWFARRWTLLVLAVVAIGGLLLPYLRDIF